MFGGGEHGSRALESKPEYRDAGGASRFFYSAKSPKSERSAGCHDLYWRMDKKHPVRITERKYLKLKRHKRPVAIGNIHPTVKSLKLMSYLCRLITPPGGVVLDCFNGSGSTGVAALREGFRYLGLEGETTYVLISRRRLTHEAERQPKVKDRTPVLFGSKA